MNFYVDPAFYVYLLVALVPAAVLGFTGHRIKRYGLAASLVFLLLLFGENWQGMAAFVAFIAIACAATFWVLRSWQSGEKALWKYRVALAAVIAPVVIYKIGAVFDQNLMGFLGISYITFKAVQVIIEVRDDIITEMNFPDYLYFLVFFAPFTSGPIDRSRRFTEDANRVYTPREYGDLLSRGLLLLLVGAVYQMVLGSVFHHFFTPAPLGDGPWWWEIGAQVKDAYMYGFYLFFDFAGYSLMAMGLARMLGFVIPRNFDLPYCSRSISEFWRRWHITLGIWFRDYLYIPLGGSRNGKRRLLLSLFVVWTLTGLWHGAAWNFVLWGLVLFVFIALEKFCIGSFLERHRFLSRLYFLFLIPQTWVVFRISDLGELGDYFSRLYPFLSSGESVFAGDLLRQLKSYWWLFALGILLATPWPRRFYEKYRATPLVWLPLFAVFWLCLYLIATGTGNPFLYARF